MCIILLKEMFKLTSDAAKTKKKPKQKIIRNLIFVFAIIALVTATIVSTINYKKAAAYKEEAEKVSQEIENYKEDADEIQALIDGEGFDEYCEKIAREKYGYAKPGEYVIYNSSHEK